MAAISHQRLILQYDVSIHVLWRQKKPQYSYLNLGENTLQSS